MKVLEITCEPILHGGQEAFIFNCLSHFPQDGIQLDVLTLYNCENEYYRKLARDRGSNIYELKIDFRPGKSRKLIKAPLYRFLKNHTYDVVHIHSGSISALAYSAEIAKSVGVKRVIVHSHSTGVNNIRHKVIQQCFSHMFNQNATVFCACSKEAGKMKYPKAVENKTVILKNGIDINKYRYSSEIRTEIRTRLSIPQDAYVIGQIGRFTYEKNQEFTVKLGNRIIEEDDRFYIIFIGDGVLKEEIKKQAKQNIYFLNSQDDVYKYYNAFDVLVLPSIYEGIPLVSIEAQANGLPIIASTGVSSEIEINDNVRRIPLEDADEWYDTLKHCKMKRTESIRELKELGWDIDNVVKTLITLYRG